MGKPASTAVARHRESGMAMALRSHRPVDPALNTGICLDGSQQGFFAFFGPFQLVPQTVQHEHLHVDDAAAVIELRWDQEFQQLGPLVEEIRIALKESLDRVWGDNVGG